MLGSTAAALWFCVWCFIRKRNVFVAEETSDLHIRELLKYHEDFPILVFEGSLVSRNSIIMISKGYHYVINLSIFSNFLYQYRQDLWRRENPDSPEFIYFHRSFAKDRYRRSILIFGKGPIVADELRGI